MGEQVSEFDEGSAVAARHGEPGVYDAALGEGWRIGDGVNGGMLLSIAGRALAAELGTAEDHRPAHPHPLAISAYYLTPGVPGPATVRTSVLRRGRAVSNGQASLLQDDGAGGEVERIRVLATYGDLATMDADATTTATPPGFRRRTSACGPTAPPPFLSGLAARAPRPAARPGHHRLGDGQAVRQRRDPRWLRMVDGREPDPLLLLLASRALPQWRSSSACRGGRRPSS